MTSLVLWSAATPAQARENQAREKLSPQIREIPLNTQTSIDPGELDAFLSKSRLLDQRLLRQAGHVLEGVDGQILLGVGSEFYARDLNAPIGTRFRLFRIGRDILDPASGEFYGVESVHLGLATVTAPPRGKDRVSRLQVLSAAEEIRPGDRLVVDFDDPLPPSLTPRHPVQAVTAQVIMVPRGVHEAGQRDVIVLNAGHNARLQAGDVLNIGAENAVIDDPVYTDTVQLPAQTIGRAMVFKVHPRIAYAILLETRRAVKIGDALYAP